MLSHIDLIVCRAGATTLAEITALGVAAILVPSPYVAHNHQFYNASVLVEARLRLMIEDKDLMRETLQEAVLPSCDDPIRWNRCGIRPIAGQAGRLRGISWTGVSN